MRISGAEGVEAVQNSYISYAGGDETLERHHNRAWPASFPAPRPVLALDRVYARGATVSRVETHESPAARRASDHLPVIARVALKDELG